MNVNETVNTFDHIGMHRPLDPAATEYTFYSNVCRIFIKTDH